MRRPGVARATGARRWALAALVAVGVAGGLGCQGQDLPARDLVADGDPELGRRAIESYGCGSCHTIPGVPGANGLVGPPLTAFSKRSFIAGQLANTAANLARWVRDPQGVEPGTAMPDLGVSAEEARNIAAYLGTLE